MTSGFLMKKKYYLIKSEAELMSLIEAMKSITFNCGKSNKISFLIKVWTVFNSLIQGVMCVKFAFRRY